MLLAEKEKFSLFSIFICEKLLTHGSRFVLIPVSGDIVII